MVKGSQATGAAYLTLSAEERISLLSNSPESSRYIKPFIGSDEFIDRSERFCIWVPDKYAKDAYQISKLSQRFELVKAQRLASPKAATQKWASKPWAFTKNRYKPTDSIIVPSVSSERREYVPIGFLGPDTVISNLAFAIYNAEPWLFALLTSKIHMVWLGAVGGKMKTDYRYSNTIVYNNFPVPHLTGPMKEKLTRTALRILDVREYFCELTLAELYDPDTMPHMLREAHADNDVLVDSIYRKSGFASDEERLAALFKLYEKLTSEEAKALEAERAAKKAAKTTRRRRKTKKEADK